MAKIMLISFTYCVVLFVGILSHNVNAVGSSIFEAEGSDSGIGNEKTVRSERTKRALAYVVPIDEENSSEEHHKSKRCFKARQLQKVRPILDSRETEFGNYGGYKSAKGLSHSAIRDILGNESTEENLKDFKLKKIKDQLNSDDYDVWALVGKRAGNKQDGKYICICKEADCLESNCRKCSIADKYGPCSTCRYYKPGFVSKVKGNVHENESEKIPLKIHYPDTRNEYPIASEIKNPGISVGKNVAVQKQKFTYDNPKIILANPNNQFAPVGQRYRILHIPMYRTQGNFYPSGNINLNENPYPYRQSIGATENSRNIIYPYQSRNGFVGSKNQPIVGSQQSGNSVYDGFYPYGLKPNLLPVCTQPQNFQYSGIVDQKVGDHGGRNNPLGSLDSLEEFKDFISDESKEVTAENFHLKDEREEAVNLNGNLYHGNDFVNKANDFESIDKPEQYKFPISYTETVGSVTKNDESYKSKEIGEFQSNDHRSSAEYKGNLNPVIQELNNENSLASHESNRDIFSEIPNHDHEISTIDDEIILEDQLENFDDYNGDTTTEFYSESEIINNDEVKNSKEPEQRISTDDIYSDIQVVTNGYFTSQAYDEFAEDNQDVNEYQVESGKEGENVMLEHGTEISDETAMKNLEANYEEKYLTSASDELKNDKSIEFPKAIFDKDEDVSYYEDSSLTLEEKNEKTPDDGLVGIAEDNDDLQDHEINVYNQVNNKHEDNLENIENTPTKYFSPNDRVLEYIKNHGQNSVVHEDSKEQVGFGNDIRDSEEDFDRELNSSVYEEISEEILNQTPKDVELGSLDSIVSHELSEEKVETFAQGTKYEEPINKQGSDVAAQYSIESTGNKNNYGEQDQLLTTNLTSEDFHEEIKDYKKNKEEEEEEEEESRVVYDSIEETYATEENESEELSSKVPEYSFVNAEEFTKHEDNLGGAWANPKTVVETINFEELGNNYSNNQGDKIKSESEGKLIPTHTQIEKNRLEVGEDFERVGNSREIETDSKMDKSDVEEYSTSGEDEYVYEYDAETSSIVNEKNNLSGNDRVITGEKSTIENSNDKILKNPLLESSAEKKAILSNLHDGYSIGQHKFENHRSGDLGESLNEHRVEYKEEINHSEKSDENLAGKIVGINSHGKILNEETAEDEKKNVDFVGKSASSKSSCTKPPEVEGDIGYLGRLVAKKSNADLELSSDLIDSDLFYIGDGVRLPVSIKKLKDGSLALSISDKICEEIINKKCPCCVPRDGEILQEKHIVKYDEEGKKHVGSVHRRAISDVENERKVDEYIKRKSRSVSMPVDKFAEKYNLILNLDDKIAEFEAAELPLIKNGIEDSLVKKLEAMNETPEKKEASILLSALQKLSTDDEEKKLASDKTEDDDKVGNKYGFMKAPYDYQRDNPILDRIEVIKQLQREKTRKCERQYQKDCDDAITQKTELLTMILHWLKDVANSSSN